MIELENAIRSILLHYDGKDDTPENQAGGIHFASSEVGVIAK